MTFLVVNLSVQKMYRFFITSFKKSTNSILFNFAIFLVL